MFRGCTNAVFAHTTVLDPYRNNTGDRLCPQKFVQTNPLNCLCDCYLVGYNSVLIEKEVLRRLEYPYGYGSIYGMYFTLWQVADTFRGWECTHSTLELYVHPQRLRHLCPRRPIRLRRNTLGAHALERLCLQCPEMSLFSSKKGTSLGTRLCSANFN